MDFIQLECFLSVAKLRNYSESAFELSISQSSVSKHIQKLERELKTRLFVRSTRHVALSEEGEAFLEHAVILMSEYHTALRKIQNFDQNLTLRIGSVDHLRKVGLTKPIASFLNKYPQLNIDLEQSDTVRLVNLLLQCKIDVALIAYIASPDLNHSNISQFDLTHYQLQTIVEDAYYVISNTENPITRKNIVTWKDLDQERVILLDSSFSSNKIIKDVFKANHITPHIVFEAKQVDTIIGLLNENYGVSLLSKSIVQGNANICSIPMINPIMRNTVLVAPHIECQSAICKKFVQHILTEPY